MTKADKPVKRETYTRERQRPLIIEICATYVKIRPKGKRTAYTVSYSQIYNIGARNAAEQLRLAKVEARKARKQGRP